MARVTFILPAYKRRFLSEAISSILAQTCTDFELVVVDDCSPENLKDVVEQFNDKRLRYVCNEKNLGGKDLIAAWNHAMEYSTSEWSVLASDDDVYAPRFLECTLALSEKYPNCDLLHARCALIDENGKWTDVAEERLEFESQIQMVYERSVKLITQRAPDFMFRTCALRAIGGFIPFPLAWYSDDATWMRLAAHGCAHTSSIEFRFRLSGENISSRYDKNTLTKIEAGEKFRVWIKDFCRTLIPRTEEESFLLKRTLELVDDRIDQLSKHLMLQIKSFVLWCKLLKHAPVSFRLKRSFVYGRYPLLRLVWACLPHWRTAK